MACNWPTQSSQATSPEACEHFRLRSRPGEGMRPADKSWRRTHNKQTTTMQNHLNRYKGAKWKASSSASHQLPLRRNMLLHSSVALLTVLMILLCDSPSPAAFAQSSGELSQQQQLLGVQRFIEEPQDTQVLVGQPADLACTVEDKRGDLFWFRNGTGLNLGPTMFPSYASRFSLPALDTQLPASQTGIANYSLHIKSVSIKDDALFYCMLSPTNGDQQQRFESRKAKLSVIQAPTKLEMQAFELAQDDSESQPVKLYSSSQPDYLLAQDQLAQDSASVNLQTGSNQGTSETFRLVVRRGMRLKLECQTDLARPDAKLIWLDSQQGDLSEQSTLAQAEASLPANATTSYVKEFVRKDSREPKLASTISTYTFTVERHHSDQLFTCQVKHSGLQSGNGPADMRRQVRLEVQFEPEVEIEREPAHKVVSEFEPVRFHCRAHGWPSQLAYSWFIDDEPVLINGSQPHLYIERATRQLHLRAIKCVAQNSVGQTSAVHRLVLNYGPSFVSHLLLSNSAAGSGSTEQQLGQQQQRPALLGQASEFGIAKQLADGFDEGQNVMLRCDFDANPRPQQVSWFRMSTDYLERKEVSPAEADELMNFGYGHRAIFHQLADSSPIPHHTTTRHWDDARSARLDYELMSQELLQEMAECSAKMRQPNATCQLDELPSHSNSLSGYIQEPLRWSIVQDSTAPPASVATNGSPEQDEESNVLRISLSTTSVDDTTTSPPNASQLQTSSLSIQRRESILSTSTITLTRANLDSVGRYICQARSSGPTTVVADSGSQVSQPTTTIARALHLVLRRGPRLISASVQYSSSLSQLQVECLAQVHTQLDNTFIWSKNGQIIDMMNRDLSASTGSGSAGHFQGAKEPKLIYNVTQYSPDLLLARSILHIKGADVHDFGKYNCTVLNSIDSNEMIIELRAPTPTGIVFNLMASLTLGSILLLVATMSLLIVCVPRRGLDSKCSGEASLATKSSHASRDSPDSGTTKQPAAAAVAVADQHCDKNTILRPPQDDKAPNLRAEAGESIYANDRFRSSSRHRNLAFSNRSGNFSAIQEGLESKLQLGSGHQINSTVKPEAQTTDLDLEGQRASGPKLDQPQDRLASVSELEKSSFLVRVMARLLMKSKQQSVKSRPVISSPLKETGSHRRSSSSLMRNKNTLSSSLDMLPVGGCNAASALEMGNSSAPESSSKGVKNTFGHINASMVSSSKANLIQDSTTASDGTNSSRSSSSQGQSRDQAELAAREVPSYTNEMYHPQHHNQLQHTNQWIAPDLPPKLSINIPISNTLQQPVNHHLPPMDCSVYVNHEMSLTSTGHLNNQPKISNNQQQQQQSDLYATCTAPQCSDQMNNLAGAGYAAADQILWSTQPPNDSSANQFIQTVPVDHYQYPIETHYNPVQSTPATCYSTVHCPVSSSQSLAGYAIHQATPQFRPPSRHQMVPTSDAGDAYFESNYGTLISRSSAYKTLGYVNSSQTTHTNSMSTCSSSPNSLIGGPPGNMNNNNNSQCIANLNPQDIHMHRSPDLRFTKRMANGYVDLEETSSGVIVVKNQGIDASLATHV